MIDKIVTSLFEKDKIYRYVLKLRTPNEKLLAIIPFTSLSFTQRFDDYDELSFSITDRLYDSHTHQQIDNPVWDRIIPNLIVELNVFSGFDKIFAEYFTAQKVDKQIGGEAEHIRNFNCVPYHQSTFNRLFLRGLDDTRKLYDFDLASYESKKDKIPLPISYKSAITIDGQEISQTESTTYGTDNYAHGGVLNYALEYILNQNINSTERETRTEGSNLYEVLTEKAVTSNGQWYIDYYDLDLLKLFLDPARKTRSPLTPEQFYNFLWGEQEWKDVSKSGVINFGQVEYQGQYLASGLYDYWVDKIQSTTGGLVLNHPVISYYTEDTKEYITTKGIEMILSVFQSIMGKVMTKPNIEDYSTLYYLYYYSQSTRTNFVNSLAFMLRGTPLIADNFESIKNLHTTDGVLLYLLEDLFLEKKGNQKNSYYVNLFQDLSMGDHIISRIEACLMKLQSIIETYVTEISSSCVAAWEQSGKKGNNPLAAIDSAYYRGYNCLKNLYISILTGLWYPFYLYFHGIPSKFPYRSLKIDNNLTETLKTLSAEFMANFEIDNINKRISIYSRMNKKYDSTNGLILSPYNYIETASISQKTDQIITRLIISGKDNISIMGVNPTGKRYVDDFSYFMTSEYMSNGLINKLKKYNEKFKKIAEEQYSPADAIKIDWQIYNKEGDPIDRVDTFYSYKDFIEAYENILNRYSQATALIQEYRQLLATRTDLVQEFDGQEIITPILKVDGMIEAKAHELGNYLERVADSVEIEKSYEFLNNRKQHMVNKIKEIQESLSYSNPDNDFTIEELKELNNFIFEEKIDMGTISDEYGLYQYAKDYLVNVRVIPIDININLLNFLNVKQFQQDWSKIHTLGQKVIFNDIKDNFMRKYLTFSEYTHAISSEGTTSLSIRLSNSKEVEDANYRLNLNTWANAYKASKDINKYRQIWEDYIQKQDVMLLQMQEINADTNKITDRDGTTIIDGNGIKLSAVDYNGISKKYDGLHSPNIEGLSYQAAANKWANFFLMIAHLQRILSLKEGTEGEKNDLMDSYVKGEIVLQDQGNDATAREKNFLLSINPDQNAKLDSILQEILGSPESSAKNKKTYLINQNALSLIEQTDISRTLAKAVENTSKLNDLLLRPMHIVDSLPTEGTPNHLYLVPAE